MNIQQQTTLEVVNIETVMADNEELYPPTPQDIYNVFAAADLLSHSSSDSAKYKCDWIKEKKNRSSIYLLGNSQTHAVEHYPLHRIIKKFPPLWLITCTIFQNKWQCN